MIQIEAFFMFLLSSAIYFKNGNHHNKKLHSGGRELLHIVKFMIFLYRAKQMCSFDVLLPFLVAFRWI